MVSRSVSEPTTNNTIRKLVVKNIAKQIVNTSSKTWLAEMGQSRWVVEL